MSSVISVITSFTIVFVLRDNFLGSLFAQAKVAPAKEQLKHKLKKDKPVVQERYKFALVARTDMSMERGKLAVVCAQAAIDCYKTASRVDPKVLQPWAYDGEPKVVLKSPEPGEEAIMKFVKKAKRQNLISCIVREPGFTQFESGNITVVGIGPGIEKLVNKVVGSLKLL